MILKIVNPSDAVTIETDDIIAAGIGITIVSDGWYGLTDEHGETVWPIVAFGGMEKFLNDKGIKDINAYIVENAEKIATILETVAYGTVPDRQLFNSAQSHMTPEEASKFRAEWNDKRRSSMTNIGENCLETARWLRDRKTKLQKQSPTIVVS